MEWYWIVVALCFGLVIGSFFNVLIWRLPRGESIIHPGSHCPACNTPVPPLHNIPLLSYALLRGTCPRCGTVINLRYPLVELGTGLGAAGIWVFMLRPGIDSASGPWEIVPLVVQALSLLVLVPVSLIDLEHYIIPDEITLPGLGIAVAAALAPGGVTPLQALMGIVAGGGSLLMVGAIGQWVLRKEDAMGGGDIKLMAFLGALWGWQITLVGIVLASFSGALVGGALLLARRLGEEHRIPFGPFLALGIWIAALWGDQLIELYLSLAF